MVFHELVLLAKCGILATYSKMPNGPNKGLFGQSFRLRHGISLLIYGCKYLHDYGVSPCSGITPPNV